MMPINMDRSQDFPPQEDSPINEVPSENENLSRRQFLQASGAFASSVLVSNMPVISSILEQSPHETEPDEKLNLIREIYGIDIYISNHYEEEKRVRLINELYEAITILPPGLNDILLMRRKEYYDILPISNNFIPKHLKVKFALGNEYLRHPDSIGYANIHEHEIEIRIAGDIEAHISQAMSLIDNNSVNTPIAILYHELSHLFHFYGSYGSEQGLWQLAPAQKYLNKNEFKETLRTTALPPYGFTTHYASTSYIEEFPELGHELFEDGLGTGGSDPRNELKRLAIARYLTWFSKGVIDVDYFRDLKNNRNLVRDPRYWINKKPSEEWLAQSDEVQIYVTDLIKGQDDSNQPFEAPALCIFSPISTDVSRQIAEQTSNTDFSQNLKLGTLEGVNASLHRTNDNQIDISVSNTQYHFVEIPTSDNYNQAEINERDHIIVIKTAHSERIILINKQGDMKLLLAKDLQRSANDTEGFPGLFKSVNNDDRFGNFIQQLCGIGIALSPAISIGVNSILEANKPKNELEDTTPDEEHEKRSKKISRRSFLGIGSKTAAVMATGAFIGAQGLLMSQDDPNRLRPFDWDTAKDRVSQLLNRPNPIHITNSGIAIGDAYSKKKSDRNFKEVR